jgi:hypothetical protein
MGDVVLPILQRCNFLRVGITNLIICPVSIRHIHLSLFPC